MEIGVIDCGSQYLMDVEIQLRRLDVEVKVIEVSKITSDSLNGAGGVIISGSPKNLTEKSGLEAFGKLQFIQELKNPVMGICFGHQCLGLMHGAEIHREEEENLNLETIEVVKSDEILSGLGKRFKMEERHSEWIDLPDEFELLAKSESCGVEMMKHRDKQAYGTQFHPEISGEVGMRVFKNFIEICGVVR